ncbi:MAG: type I restriction-modification system subunit M [Bacteroidales bacterium]|nr:type I restriction-modification system subunit M [Bacteroidales bacterium]
MELTNKLWGLCNTLRHDGVDSSDYVEQLTYLLFIKLADSYNVDVPNDCRWNTFLEKENKDLLPHIETVFLNLQKQKNILGDIFAEPISRIRKPESLRKIIDLIDKIKWNAFDADIIGLAFEELIGKVANDGKKGAGQYFTPRPLIRAMVEAVKPNPLEKDNFTISDVATGTSGFLMISHEWQDEVNSKKRLTKKQLERISNNTYFGQELVARPRRLALMNMFLRGVRAKIKLGDSIYEKLDNKKFSVILTNPPFGTKGSKQIPDRKDFLVKTTNKQLNFIQHVISSLEDDGRAAIVLPDSVLTDNKAVKIWENIMDYCNIHTILKLPTGTFAAYAAGVNAVVVFLQKGVPTKNMWMFDARTNVEKVTKRMRPLNELHFEEFLEAYGKNSNGNSKRKENDRFKKFTIKKIKENNYNLDFRWMNELYDGVDLSQYKNSKELFGAMLQDFEDALNMLKRYHGTL